MENIDETIEENTCVFFNKRFGPETCDVVYKGDVKVLSKKKQRIENRKDLYLKNKETF